MQFRTFTPQDTAGNYQPTATATVYEEGTQTLATIYDADDQAISNPVSANADGQISFAAANGVYDIQFNLTNPSVTQTLYSERFYDAPEAIAAVQAAAADAESAKTDAEAAETAAEGWYTQTAAAAAIPGTATVNGSLVTLTVADGTTITNGLIFVATIPQAITGAPQIKINDSSSTLLAATNVQSTEGEAIALGAQLYYFKYDSSNSRIVPSGGGGASDDITQVGAVYAPIDYQQGTAGVVSTSTPYIHQMSGTSSRIQYQVPIDPSDFPNGKCVVELKIEDRTGDPSSTEVTQRDNNSDISGTTQTLTLADDYFRAEVTLDADCDEIEVNLFGDSSTDLQFRGLNIRKTTEVIVHDPVADNIPLSLIKTTTARQTEPEVDVLRGVEPLLITGSTAPSVSGRTITFPLNVRGGIRFDPSVIDQGDTLLVGFVSNVGLPQVNLRMMVTGSNRGDAETTTYEQRGELPTGLLTFVYLNNITWTGSDAITDAQLDIRADQLSDALECEILFMVRGTISPTEIKAGFASRELIRTSVGKRVVVDSVDGDDSLTGGESDPVATIARAKALGATEILLNTGRHQIDDLLTADGEKKFSLISYRKSGTTEEMAKLRASTRITSSDLTATSANPNVYYYATSTSPGDAIFAETVSTGAIKRFGELQDHPSAPANHRQYAQASADEAAVRAATGRWWYGTGSEGEGVYIRPEGDTLSDTAYELPKINIAMSVTGVGLMQFYGVEVGFAKENALSVERSTVDAVNSRFGYTSNSDGVALSNYVIWNGRGNEYTQAGDDGVDYGYNVTHTETNLKTHLNVGDGHATHYGNNNLRFDGGQIVNNGKQGIVGVLLSGTGQDVFEVNGTFFNGNFSTDHLYIKGTGYTVDATLLATFGTVAVSGTGDNSTVQVLARNHTGTITETGGTFDVS